MQDIDISEINWSKSYRLISSRFPPIDLFERIADPKDWELICEIESLTNPRLRQEIGQISLVPKDKRIYGNGASYVMAAFTHLNKDGSRFSDGSFGVYYAAKDLLTAQMEIIYRLERFYASTKEDPIYSDFRLLVGKIKGFFHDIRASKEEYRKYYDLNSWTNSQKLGKILRSAQSNGILYNSVRDIKGECVAVFWPNKVAIPKQSRHFRYYWDGNKIIKYYDFEDKKWHKIS